MAAETGGPSSPVPDDASTAEVTGAPRGVQDFIGAYRILRTLGEGGMGIVYEAEQQNPKRLVALKVIRGGRYVDEHHIRLFEREIQALARLRHPAIAAIYESGRTAEGQHFFAMELVRGETLQEYLIRPDQRAPLTQMQIRERLAVFRKVADGVTYAHQRGVVHRDLKPSNIFIQRELSTPDSQSGAAVPAVKILDFGLARITETDIAAATVATEVGRIQGTLPYMSPEQIRGNPDEIDLRTDVYSLGIILYEMLAGRAPYDLQKAMLHEAAQIICEVPPTPLSKSWSGRGRLDKDLGTIVDKALEKQSAMRYQSVSAFADDVGRFLAGQPIQARPPSGLYQFRKLVARHKYGFGFAATLVVLISVFGIAMSIQAQRIARERDRANSQARIAHRVSEFLVGLFQVSDPIEGRGKDITARQVFDQGSQRISAELRDQPEVGAALMHTVGHVYLNLGEFDRALELTTRALDVRRRTLGKDSIDTAATLNLLGLIRTGKGDYNEAETALQEALKIRASKAGPESAEAADSLHSLGSLRWRRGELLEAERYLREASQIYRTVLPADDLRVSSSINDVALMQSILEKFAEAERLNQEAWNERVRILGNQHPLVAQSINNHAMIFLRQKRYADAEPLFHQALAINRKALGETHPDVLSNLNNLALLSLEHGDLAKAEEYYRLVLDLDFRSYGRDHPQTAQTTQSLGVVLNREKKFLEAERLLRQAYALKLARFSDSHWEPATTENLLALCLMDQGRHKEAGPLLLHSFEVIRKQFGPRHDRTRRAGSRLIAYYEKTGHPQRASAIRAEIEPPKP